MRSGKRTSDKTIPKVKRSLKDNLSISITLTKIIPDSEEHINKILTDLMKERCKKNNIPKVIEVISAYKAFKAMSRRKMANV